MAAEEVPLPDEMLPQREGELARLIQQALPTSKGNALGFLDGFMGMFGSKKAAPQPQGSAFPHPTRQPAQTEDITGNNRRKKGEEEELNAMGSRLKQMKTNFNEQEVTAQGYDSREAQSQTRSLGEKFGYAPQNDSNEDLGLTLAESIRRKISETAKPADEEDGPAQQQQPNSESWQNVPQPGFGGQPAGFAQGGPPGQNFAGGPPQGYSNAPAPGFAPPQGAFQGAGGNAPASGAPGFGQSPFDAPAQTAQPAMGWAAPAQDNNWGQQAPGAPAPGVQQGQPAQWGAAAWDQPATAGGASAPGIAGAADWGAPSPQPAPSNQWGGAPGTADGGAAWGAPQAPAQQNPSWGAPQPQPVAPDAGWAGGQQPQPVAAQNQGWAPEAKSDSWGQPAGPDWGSPPQAPQQPAPGGWDQPQQQQPAPGGWEQQQQQPAQPAWGQPTDANNWGNNGGTNGGGTPAPAISTPPSQPAPSIPPAPVAAAKADHKHHAFDLRAELVETGTWRAFAPVDPLSPKAPPALPKTESIPPPGGGSAPDASRWDVPIQDRMKGQNSGGSPAAAPPAAPAAFAPGGAPPPGQWAQPQQQPVQSGGQTAAAVEEPSHTKSGWDFPVYETDEQLTGSGWGPPQGQGTAPGQAQPAQQAHSVMDKLGNAIGDAARNSIPPQNAPAAGAPQAADSWELSIQERQQLQQQQMNAQQQPPQQFAPPQQAGGWGQPAQPAADQGWGAPAQQPAWGAPAPAPAPTPAPSPAPAAAPAPAADDGRQKLFAPIDDNAIDKLFNDNLGIQDGGPRANQAPAAPAAPEAPPWGAPQAPPPQAPAWGAPAAAAPAAPAWGAPAPTEPPVAPAWGAPAPAEAPAAPAWGAPAPAGPPAAPAWGAPAPAEAPAAPAWGAPAPAEPPAAPAWGAPAPAPSDPPAAPAWGAPAAAAPAAPAWGAAPAQTPPSPPSNGGGFGAPEVAPAPAQPAKGGGLFNLGDDDMDRLFGDNLGVNDQKVEAKPTSIPPAPAPAQPAWGQPPAQAPQQGQPAWGAPQGQPAAPAWGAPPAPQHEQAPPAAQAPAWGAPPPAPQQDQAQPAWGAPPAAQPPAQPAWGQPPSQPEGQAWAAPGQVPPSQTGWGAPPAAPGAEQPAPWGAPPAPPTPPPNPFAAMTTSQYGMQAQQQSPQISPIQSAPQAPPPPPPPPPPAPEVPQKPASAGLFSIDDSVIDKIFSDNLGVNDAPGRSKDATAAQQAPAVPPPKIEGVGRLDSRVDHNQDAGSGRISSIGKFLLDQKDFEKIGKMSNADLTDSSMKILTQEAAGELTSLLHHIAGQNAVVGSVIVGHDGLLIANTMPPEMDAESVGVWALGVYMNTQHVVRKMGQNIVHQIVSKTPKGYLVIADFGGGLLVVLSDGKDTDTLIPLMRSITQLIQ